MNADVFLVKFSLYMNSSLLFTWREEITRNMSAFAGYMWLFPNILCYFLWNTSNYGNAQECSLED